MLFKLNVLALVVVIFSVVCVSWTIGWAGWNRTCSRGCPFVVSEGTQRAVKLDIIGKLRK